MKVYCIGGSLDGQICDAPLDDPQLTAQFYVAHWSGEYPTTAPERECYMRSPNDRAYCTNMQDSVVARIGPSDGREFYRPYYDGEYVLPVFEFVESYKPKPKPKARSPILPVEDSDFCKLKE